MPFLPSEELRILDSGGGSGVLAAAAAVEFCSRPKSRRPSALHATVWEIDGLLAGDLTRTLRYCGAVCREAGVAFTGDLRQGNFILDAADLVDGGDSSLLRIRSSSVSMWRS